MSTEYISTTLTKVSQNNKLLTLLFLLDPPNNQILLAQKKRGFGLNKWNGFGGKVDKNETIEEATIREMEEESTMKIDIKHIEKHGIMIQEFDDPSLAVLEIHIFTCTEFNNQKPQETEEMKPKWFNYDEIPYDSMWLDDERWLPSLLQNKYFQAHYLYHGMDHIVTEKTN